MGTTSIEWTDESVNPFRARLAGSTKTAGGYNSGVGHYCEKVSPGCKNCYSSTTQPRFGLPVFQEQRRAGVETFLDPSKLEEVLRRKKPTKFFWCDMTDMFGEWVPDEWIAACFGVMAATPHHTHQVLTKRAKRAREWFDEVALDEGKRTKFSAYLTSVVEASRRLWPDAPDMGPVFEKRDVFTDRLIPEKMMRPGAAVPWPLPNVWLGVSVEDQQRADERIPELLATPAAVRFVSYEPALGPVDFNPWLYGAPRLDWIIVGGES